MRKPKILIVEDESLVAIDIEETLSSLYYNVGGVATNGEDAVRMANELRPDLVLMDIMLEGEVDGISAAREIRETLQIPVVYLTAHADKATLDRAKVTEPYGYVLKPFREMELRTVIELALHRHQSELERGTPAAPLERHEPAAPAGPHAVPNFAALVDVERAPSKQGQISIINVLQHVEPFNRLDQNFLAAAAAVCSFSRHEAGDFVAMEGDKESPGFIVVDGRVAMVKTSASGKDLIVELLAPRDPFVLLSALEKSPYPFSAKAQVESTVLWVPRPVVAAVLEHYPELSRQFIERVLERLRRAHDLSRTLAHDRVEVRIASALLALIPKFCATDETQSSYDIVMTRQELAELTGTTPETVSRVVTALEREELLDLSQSRKVRILDRTGLESIVES